VVDDVVYDFNMVSGVTSTDNENGRIALTCVSDYARTVYFAFLLHQANGGNGVEPEIYIRCTDDSSRNCGLVAYGNVNNAGLTFPNSICDWSQKNQNKCNCGAGDDTKACACPWPLPTIQGLFTNGEFDNAMELVFGTKTSVGFLCGVKEAVKDAFNDPLKNVAIPGYCCLDSPYDSEESWWGKSVSVWLRRRFLVSKLNSSRTHDCAISSFYFLDIRTY
jgi:hypothetical protein